MLCTELYFGSAIRKKYKNGHDFRVPCALLFAYVSLYKCSELSQTFKHPPFIRCESLLFCNP